jgi:hypothetical protein
MIKEALREREAERDFECLVNLLLRLKCVVVETLKNLIFIVIPTYV